MMSVLAHHRFGKLSALTLRRGVLGVSGISTIAEVSFTAYSWLDAMAFQLRVWAAKLFGKRALSHDYLV